MKRLICLVVLAMFAVVMLIGCATRYQKAGATGGYSDAQIDANTFLVEFRGNGNTSRQTVETYLLYRCAEVTIGAGYDFFVIVVGGVDTKETLSTTTTQGSYSSSTSGIATRSGSNVIIANTATTGTYTPPETHTSTITRHRGSVRIKGFKGEKPADNPNAYDARETMKYIGPSIK